MTTINTIKNKNKIQGSVKQFKFVIGKDYTKKIEIGLKDSQYGLDFHANLTPKEMVELYSEIFKTFYPGFNSKYLKRAITVCCEIIQLAELTEYALQFTRKTGECYNSPIIFLKMLATIGQINGELQFASRAILGEVETETKEKLNSFAPMLTQAFFKSVRYQQKILLNIVDKKHFTEIQIMAVDLITGFQSDSNFLKKFGTCFGIGVINISDSISKNKIQFSSFEGTQNYFIERIFKIYLKNQLIKTVLNS